MEIAPSDRIEHQIKPPVHPKGFRISFDSVLLKEDSQEVFEIYPLTLEIN